MKKRAALQVLLPISILSFIFSYYYSFSCVPCFVHSLNLVIKQLLTSKKSMFLFSNIIFAFLARGSSFSKEHQIKEDFVHEQQQTMDLIVVEDESEAETESEAEAETETESETEAETETEAEAEAETEAETETEAGEEEDEEIEEMEVMDDELDLLGIDELNRKFEEFIERERMKRRLEEALQLAML